MLKSEQATYVIITIYDSHYKLCRPAITPLIGVSNARVML